MQCPACRHENPPQAKFCLECGARAIVACPACRAELPPSAKFCLECGARVTAAEVSPGSRFVSPEAYTPKHLAERILMSREALEGERKEVTVLFADLKGSLALLADRDPEDARTVIDPVLERMMEAVHRYEGTVNQVLGDGIMALFGAPLACEDHAVRACYAALRMQEAVKEYAERVRRTIGLPVQIRVGLNSGDVIVRAIRSDLHMDYSAVGQTTHVAARMEQMAVPGSVLLSGETLARAEGYVDVRALGPLPVKGLDGPLEVYELVGATTVRSRFQAAAARGLSRFIGRDVELQQLQQTLDRVRAGHGQIVAVVGDAGVGKSRLYWEFSHSHRAHGWLILESGSVSYGKATNYLPILELLRAYFTIETADDARKILEKVTGKLVSLDRVLEHCITPILWLLDVPVADPRWDQLDPPQRRQQVLDAVKQLLLRESQVQPLMVLFEDLHWIDAETQAFLDSLVENVPTARMLLLVNYRPEYEHRWGNRTYYRQLQIDPLPRERADDLLDSLLGANTELRPLKGLINERTEGNPFFIEETVRSLVETGVLTGDRGAYRLTRTVNALHVPASARAILAARIDRLGPDDKRLLQAAAVIGSDVPIALLEAVAGEPDERLRRSLANLQATEFLYETRLFPEIEYTFRHALTHEVAYGSLLVQRRREIHARVVQAMEEAYGDRLAEHVEELAHHAVHGELWNKAVTYCGQSGTKAIARSANREAAAYLERALDALARIPEDDGVRTKDIDLRIEMRHALWPLGEIARILHYLERAQTLAEALGDQARFVRVRALMGYCFWMRGEHARVVTSNEQALSIATALGDFSLQAPVKFALGLAYHGLGHYRQAVAVASGAIDSLQGERRYRRFGTAGTTSVLCTMVLAWSQAELGAFADGIASGEESVRVANAVDHPLSLMFADVGVGHLYLVQGDLVRAVPALERGLHACRTWEFPSWLPWLASRLGLAYVMAGRLDDGLPLLEESVEQAEAMGWRADASSLAVRLAEGYLAASDVDRARRVADRALSLAVEHEARGQRAWAEHVLAQLALLEMTDDVPAAERRQRAALAIAEELGMRPLAARCHAGLATLYRRAGQASLARSCFATAAAMYREMGMTYWLDRLENDARDGPAV
jgi:class 3 adenylate cyclase/tetratricopeptide (TPR) repeat protein